MFDLDGVLIDSEPVWREVEAEVARDFGFTYSDDLARRLHGRGTIGAGRIISELTGDEATGLAAAEAMVERMVERGAAGAVPEMPGARELLDALRGRVRLAVASNSVRRYVEGSVRDLGPFDAVVAGDEVERTKPDPDVYLRAAERLGLAPERCVAVEDAPVGIEAAIAAGMRVVSVGGLVELPPPLPGERRVPSLRALDAETLLSA